MSIKIDLKALATMSFLEGIEYINDCYDLELEPEDFNFIVDAPDLINAAVIEATADTSNEDNKDEIEADGISFFYYNIRYIEEEQDIKKLEDLYGFEIEHSDEDEDEDSNDDVDEDEASNDDVDYDYFNECIAEVCNNNYDIDELLEDLEDAFGVWGAYFTNGDDSGIAFIEEWQKNKMERKKNEEK